MAENIVLEKSYRYALKTVSLYLYLTEERKEFVMSKSLLASGTEPGARVKAAQEAESKEGFTREMSYALQYASKSQYWLQLLFESGYLKEDDFNVANEECAELMKLLTKIVKSSKGIR